MKHAKFLSSLLAIGTVVVALQVPANAQMRTSRGTYQAPGAAGGNNYLGLGLKSGNGIGGGLDLILNPSSNLSFDIQAGLTPLGGFGIAPEVQFLMDPSSGPYAGVGLSYNPASTGVFGNVGWQMKPVTNVGILLGIGYLYGLTGGGSGLNYEVGLRYFFQ